MSLFWFWWKLSLFHFNFPIQCHRHLRRVGSVMFLPNSIHCKEKKIELNSASILFYTAQIYIAILHLSNDGSLLNISVGTVAGASNMPISDCFDCKCRSTSSAVMWPSVMVSVLMVSVFRMAGADGAVWFNFFCVCFRRFGGFAFLFCVAFVALFFRLISVLLKKKR